MDPVFKSPPLRYEEGNFSGIHVITVKSAAQVNQLFDWMHTEERGQGKRLEHTPVINPTWGWELIEEPVDQVHRLLAYTVRTSFLERGL